MIFFTCLGVAAAMVMGVMVLVYAFAAVIAGWQARNDRPVLDRLKGRISQLDRWCAYEYPIIEDVAKHLLDGGDISNFRDELRRKYPTERAR